MSVELHISYDLLDELLNFLELTDLNLEINSLRKIQTQFDKLKSMFNEENSIKWFSEIQSKINDKMRTANLKES